MNYLRVHAAAKRRFLANRDIFGLLKNGRHRCAKKKNKAPVPARNFGILSRALSFKLALQDESDSGEKNIVVIPIGHTRKLYSAKQKKATKKTSAKAKEKEGWEEVTTNERQAKNDAVEQQTKKPAPVTERNSGVNQNATTIHNSKMEMSKNPNQREESTSANFTSANVIPSEMIHMEETPSTDHTIQTIPPDFNEFIDNDNPIHQEKEQMSIFAGYETPLTNESSHKMLSFDSVIAPDLQENGLSTTNIFNNFNGSIGFSPEKNQFRAGPDTMTPLDFNSVRSVFPEKPNKKNISSKTIKSGWSLDTPDISQSISSTESTNTTLHSFNPIEDSPLDHPTFAIPTQNVFMSTPASIPMFKFNSAAIPSKFTLNNNETDWDDLPKLTMEMVIKRKQLGARRAYERLFGETKRPRVETLNHSFTLNTPTTYMGRQKKLQPTTTFGSFNTRITSRNQTMQQPTTFGSFKTHIAANLPSVNSTEVYPVSSRSGYNSTEDTTFQSTTFGSFNTRIGNSASIPAPFKIGKEKNTKEIPRLIRERVMQRKRLAARRSLDRLFNERNKQRSTSKMDLNNNDNIFAMGTKNNSQSMQTKYSNLHAKYPTIDAKRRTTHPNVFKSFLSFGESPFNESIAI